MKPLRAAVRRARREHRDERQGRGAAALLRRRPRRPMRPGRCTSSPAASRARCVPTAALRALAVRARGHRRLAVRGVLPGRRRSGRDHRPRAAAARARAATSAWPTGSQQRLLPLRGAEPAEQAAAHRAVVRRARPRRPLPARQADRRRLSRRREQAAGAARAGRARRAGCQAGRAAHDGLHRCEGDARRRGATRGSSAPAVDRPQPRPASPIRSSWRMRSTWPPADFDAKLGPAATGWSSGSTTASARSSCGATGRSGSGRAARSW